MAAPLGVGDPIDFDVRTFAKILKKLPTRTPISDKFEGVSSQRGGAARNWQREKMVGWFRDQATLGFGAYSREKPNYSARTTWQRLAYPGGMIWIAEALGVPGDVVEAAVAEVNAQTDKRRRCGVIRSHIPWEMIAERAYEHQQNQRMRGRMPSWPRIRTENVTAQDQTSGRAVPDTHIRPTTTHWGWSGVMKKWILEDPSSVQALFPNKRRGIYILHFKNGEQYVGKTENIVVRFAQHRRGSAHHGPWEDVVALEFLHVPKRKLDPIERKWIYKRGRQVNLRNKTFNFRYVRA